MRRWAEVYFKVAIVTSAIVAFAGGAALALFEGLIPDTDLRPVRGTFLHLLAAFGLTALLGVAWAAVDRLLRGAPEPAPPPPAPPAPVKIESGVRPAVETDLPTAFQQMRTYIDLEMWELALDKASYILSSFPDSREAQVVNRNLNELRWKAEPKFVQRVTGVSATEERQLQEKGLAAMFEHVRTYMELEMWELAKQKAVAVMKHFPDSKEAGEVLPLYQQIEAKLKEKAAKPAPQPVPEKKG